MAAKDPDETSPPPIPTKSTVESEFTIKSPKGRKYVVRRTNQKDEYEEEAPKPPPETPPDKS
jgi:hypothetical protein